MKTLYNIDFETYPEDFESYFERALEEGDFDARIQRHMICKTFSEFENAFYEKRYALEYEMFSKELLEVTQEQLEQLAQYKQEIINNFSLSENNYMIFVHRKQCETFQSDLILNQIDINQLKSDADTQKLVELFIKNYIFLELVPPSNPLVGHFFEPVGHIVVH